MCIYIHFEGFVVIKSIIIFFSVSFTIKTDSYEILFVRSSVFTATSSVGQLTFKWGIVLFNNYNALYTEN